MKRDIGIDINPQKQISPKLNYIYKRIIKPPNQYFVFCPSNNLYMALLFFRKISLKKSIDTLHFGVYN